MTGARLPLRSMGDRGLLIDVPDVPAARSVRTALLAAAVPGVQDVVAGDGTVLVVVDPLRADPDRVLAVAAAANLSGPDRTPAREHLLPVRYDGADLSAVAAATGLPRAEVVRRHAAATCTVAFVGFAPGFGYLTGLDPALHLPRRRSPRERVPAGAVAVAGGYTAVYPSPSPGGWWLLGSTDVRLFDPDADPPALLAAGDRVRFRPVP